MSSKFSPPPTPTLPSWSSTMRAKKHSEKLQTPRVRNLASTCVSTSTTESCSPENETAICHNSHCCPTCYTKVCVFTPFVRHGRPCWRCGYEWPSYCLLPSELPEFGAARDMDVAFTDECRMCSGTKIHTAGMAHCLKCASWLYSGLEFDYVEK